MRSCDTGRCSYSTAAYTVRRCHTLRPSRTLDLALYSTHKPPPVSCNSLSLKAKFHYTGPTPTGPARTRTDFVGDPHGPNGVSRRPRPQKSTRGSGRARVVEFSYYSTYIYVGLSSLNTSVLPTYLLRLRCFQLICHYICDPSVCPSTSTLLLAQSGALSRYAYYHTLIRNSGPGAL